MLQHEELGELIRTELIFRPERRFGKVKMSRTCADDDDEGGLLKPASL